MKIVTEKSNAYWTAIWQFFTPTHTRVGFLFYNIAPQEVKRQIRFCCILPYELL